jgi:hypothetical protein
MNRFLPLFASSLGWLLCAGSAARADMTPTQTAQWSYNFSPTMKNNQVLATDGLSGVNFTNEPTTHEPGNTSTQIVASNLKVFSNSASPVGFGSGGGYSFALTLTDPSGATANYVFNNTLSGTMSAHSSTVTSQLSGFSGTVTVNGKTTSFTGPNAPTITLGNSNYQVSMTSFTGPSAPDAHNSGAIGGFVTVTPGNIVPATVPEPSSLVLCGLGLSFAGLAIWRKRRQSLAAVLA